MRITAQDLYNYTQCRHRVYLDANADPRERDQASEFLKMLWEMGLQTERRYLDTLGDVTVENLQALGLAEAEAHTDTLMRAGAEVIYQGVIRSGDLVGRPDLLVKHSDAPSKLGDFYYEPIDIKAGRGWEQRGGKRTRFKEHYAYQLLFYREILKALQGRLPSEARIIDADGELEAFDPRAFQGSFAGALDTVRSLIAGEETSEPVLGSPCHLCHWYSRCRRWVEETHDPTGLFSVGQIKFTLKSFGLRTIEDIAAIEPDDFVDSNGVCRIPHVGEKTLRRLKRRAQVLLDGKPLLLPGYAFPSARREIYFDVEDDPTQGITYLFGFLERDTAGALAYRYFMADSPAQEEAAARRCWDYLAEVQDAVFYVYSAKERSTLRQLMNRYALDEQVFRRYRAAEFDLYTDLIMKYSDWPTYSYGIKQIAQCVGFEWRDPDPSGANSIVWYNDYVRQPDRRDIRQRILDYNEDDCRAMVAVKDYFERYRVGRGTGKAIND